MKTLSSILMFSLLLFFTATCSEAAKEETDSEPALLNETAMEITGTIREQEITSYQYGTHTISTANEEFYALKSETVDLNDYLQKEVTIIAEKIEGYPIEGGPEYLLVLEVKGR